MKTFLVKTFTLDGYEIRTEGIVGGSRPRILVKNKKNHHLYFIKWYSKNPRELWVEKFASELGKRIPDVDIQDVSLLTLPNEVIEKLREQTDNPATLHNISILIQHAFPSGFENQHGFQVLGLNPRDNSSFKQVFERINRRYGFAGLQDSLLQSYSDMIVFDALIGNMDRHLENWGILENKDFRDPQMRLTPKESLKESVKFTPFFDHGSAGLYELTEEKVQYYLGHLVEFEKQYILGSKYSLLSGDAGGAMNVFDTLKEQVRHSEWKRFIKKSIGKIKKLKLLDIAEVIFKIPNIEELNYSKERKELLFQGCIMRKKHLLNITNQ